MMDDAWLIYFEDREVPPEIYTGEDAEANARARYAVLLQSWSCHLFRAADLEICLCAAIRMPDGEVVRGHRHNNCYDVVCARAIYWSTQLSMINKSLEYAKDIAKAAHGFLTSRGRFVDREEGMALMRASGLPSHYGRDGKYVGAGLFSEDLYPNGPIVS